MSPDADSSVETSLVSLNGCVELAAPAWKGRVPVLPFPSFFFVFSFLKAFKWKNLFAWAASFTRGSLRRFTSEWKIKTRSSCQQGHKLKQCCFWCFAASYLLVRKINKRARSLRPRIAVTAACLSHDYVVKITTPLQQSRFRAPHGETSAVSIRRPPSQRDGLRPATLHQCTFGGNCNTDTYHLEAYKCIHCDTIEEAFF